MLGRSSASSEGPPQAAAGSAGSGKGGAKGSRASSEGPPQAAAGSAGSGKGGAKGSRTASWGPGGRGRGKGGFPREVQISKALSLVLRHTAVGLGIAIRADGFCPAAELLQVAALKGLGCTLEDIKSAVNSSDKKRFEMTVEGDEVLVRANQGHSIKAVSDDSLLRRLAPADANLPDACVHGTYRRHLQSILRKGLLPGGGVSQRNHVHFAPFEPGDGRVISGMRYNCEVAIYVDLKRALQDGVPFFMSTNEVILSPGLNGSVPCSYFEKVKDLATGKVTKGCSLSSLAV